MRIPTRESLIAFGKRRWSSGAILVLVVLLGYGMEEHSDQFPWLTTAQLKCASLLSQADVRTPIVERVTVVEIDDNTFWKQLAGVLPTDRHFLASLVRIGSGNNALGLKAAAIAIDIKLVSPYDKPGDDSSRNDANGDLLRAVQEAANRGVPTVLTASLVADATKREPNIFEDQEWAHGTRFGYINLPTDKRLVPLDAMVEDWHGQDAVPLNSFALETALAYEQVHHLEANPMVRKAMLHGDFLDAGFLKQKKFPGVSASDIKSENQQALALINQRIMMIGSTWRESGTRGDFFLTPVGEMRIGEARRDSSFSCGVRTFL